jgi:hypothetical protein
MRSDAPDTGKVLETLAPALADYRSAVADALEEVRAWRAQRQESTADPVGRLTRELGHFARGLIDPRRLSSLVAVEEGPTPLTAHLMDEAFDLFAGIHGDGFAAFELVVPSGGDLRDAVRDRLASLGRAFGMAHAVERAKRHAYDPDTDFELLQDYPFHRWSVAEKEIAPPLLVRVQAADLRAPGLSEFLEGAQKLVLLVEGDAPPAPLARLVSPWVYVAQVAGAAGEVRVRELARREGAGIVAVFPADADILSFAQRPGMALEVDRDELAARIETVSGRRGQPGIVDLRHLQALAAVAAPPRAESSAPAATSHAGPTPSSAGQTPRGAAPPTDTGGTPAPPSGQGGLTVDRLAAWLLSRTDLDGAAEEIPHGTSPGAPGAPGGS